MQLSSDREQPFWTTDLRPINDDIVELGERFDAIVVGAGYAGLNASVELSRQGMKVLVVEARAIGEGASSKAAGSLANSLKARLHDLTQRYGREVAQSAYEEAVRARAFTEEMIEANGLDCDLQRSERIVGAHSTKSLARLQRELPAMRQSLPDTRLLSREEFASFVNAPSYIGGMLVPQAATLNPAKYQFALARLAQDAGAKILQRRPMTDFQRTEGGFSIQVAGLGSLRASHLYLATSVESGTFSQNALLQHIARGTAAIPAFVVVSKTLSREQMDKVIKGVRIFGDTRKILNYLALSPDGTRLVYSSRSGFTEGTTVEKARRIVADYEHRFPGTEGIGYDHFWMGRFAITMDLIPHIGSSDGVFWSTGDCGTGITMSSYLGYKVARRILRTNEAKTVFELPLPRMQLWRRQPALLGAAIRAYRIYDKYMH